jgi:DNA-directed RNA polymerase specialized sigma24 family protein
MNVSDLNIESDPKILEDRFARCRRLLHFLAARILGSQDEAEYAVRNCRAAASRNPPSFKSEGAFRSWLARILIDEACAVVRQNEIVSSHEVKVGPISPARSSLQHSG